MTEIASIQKQVPFSFAESIKDVFNKLTWKSALIIIVPVALYIYPKPLVKLFLPLINIINKDHSSIKGVHHIQQIILATNQNLNLNNLKSIVITKGVVPRVDSFNEKECLTVELFRKNNRLNSSLYVDKPQNIYEDEMNSLYAQDLWSNFRLTKLENPSAKLMLIKSTQTILQHFLLKFYKLNQREIHKTGVFGANNLHILRLNESLGTYQHFISEFQSRELIIFE